MENADRLLFDYPLPLGNGVGCHYVTRIGRPGASESETPAIAGLQIGRAHV